MAAQSYDIEFKGYRLESKKAGIPAGSGIYCVYRGVYNAKADTVSLKELIYIGESADINARVVSHDRLDDWSDRLQAGEILCYSYALVPSADRLRVEAALIHKHTPPLNTEYSNAFPFDETTISVKGDRAAELTKDFVVKRK
ncbi:GIY-YIG nuclease family protein [Burkholderia stagnalis]|uniref:GIY-YIG nuclease family protein n=1 Tax=Burkholderia stagnalis TaxID=1503054 RepID=UPI000F5666E9|nr:GIY-YIG nuclease family protein [Burkholderia stagnalis]RQQ28075.1 GIY-YIG nuclease family protein [Burkholderia stagnalis]RQQ32922.1 GIY-YIG nuclease family protein [Burkholderia stagnalis]RQQ48870.1 GIY-YIG nuclease family protein [Burkholderia stagnalis]RQX85984.1 GIY-YIG nuclease family protein [Burkholderia stagnalis]RQY28359.1 GIY-YIG nuclease family protein [Burkholderia stagnalis]